MYDCLSQDMTQAIVKREKMIHSPWPFPDKTVELFSYYHMMSKRNFETTLSWKAQFGWAKKSVKYHQWEFRPKATERDL